MHARFLTSLAMLLAVGGAAPTTPAAKPAAAPADASNTPEYWKPHQQTIASLADGFIVWESRRNADHNWSIWTIRLDGSGLRQLAPKETDRHQQSPHISPDGKRIIYLSKSVKKNSKDPSPLHIVNRDGTGDKVLVANAMNYSGWDRAVVWFNDNEIAFINRDDGNTYRLNLTTGDKTLLIERGGGPDSPSWLPNPTLTYAVWSFNTFSPLDAKAHRVNPMPSIGGCQPYFTADGRWGFWMRTPGGPMGRMLLSTRAVSTLQDGAAMPCNRRFIYFPMISDSQRYLVFAAVQPDRLIGGYCGGEESDYDIFLAQLDPKTLDLISKPVRYTFDPKTDRFPDVWQAEPSLGFHTDKTPLDVNLAPKGSGEWQWDFGDGATAKGAVGKHTYTRPGVYIVKAMSGATVLAGQVRVREATTPKAEGAMLEGDKEITVSFSEPVQVKDIKLAMESKARIEKWSLSEDGRALKIVLADKLAKDDWLAIDGVADQAQHPNKMARTRLAVLTRTWPTNADGLVYLWQDGAKPNKVRNPGTGQVRSYDLERRDRVWVDRSFALVLDGGMVKVRGFYDDLSNAVRKSNRFSMELTLTPRDLQRDNQSILSHGLRQSKDKLVYSLFGRRWELCTVEANKPQHIAVVYRPGRIVAYRNGQQVFATKDGEKVPPNLDRWSSSPTLMGGDLDNRTWLGTVEGVALYHRALSPEEVKANASAYMNIVCSRKPAERLELEGKLVEASKIPTLKEIQPYTRGLATYEFEVTKVLAGQYGAKTVRVADWAILDREPTRFAQLPIGAKAHLVLENKALNPQLASENTTDTLEINPDLPQFLAVSGTTYEHAGTPVWNFIGASGPVGDAPAGLGNVVKDYKPAADRKGRILKPRQDGSDLEAKLRAPSPGYLVVYVTSPDDRKAILSAWAVGGMKGWLNGKVAFDVREFGRYPFCGNRRFAAQLKKGINELVIAVPGLHGQTQFICDILDADGREMPDLTYAPEMK